MIMGHPGLAAGAKATGLSAAPWSLMLATMWLDVVFTPLYLAGAEPLDTPPGGGYGTSVIHADFTHSLLGALMIVLEAGLLLGGVFCYWRGCTPRRPALNGQAHPGRRECGIACVGRRRVFTTATTGLLRGGRPPWPPSSGSATPSTEH
jgi:hypothetical protein